MKVRGFVDFVLAERDGRPGEIGFDGVRYLAKDAVVKQAANAFGDHVEVTFDEISGVKICTGIHVYAEQPSLFQEPA